MTTIAGIIEGFYGTPWSWPDRLEIARFCADHAMTHYVYAPKDDPLHRTRWREPYGAEMLGAFEHLVERSPLTTGFAISPGLSMDYSSESDRAALAAKVRQLTDLGIRLVILALDDIPVAPGLGRDHAELTSWLYDEIASGSDTELVLVPTEYTGTSRTAYLDALATGVPSDVPIAWTGPTVVCDELSRDDALARASSIGGRAPLVWDNYPVNDAIMADRLLLGPLRGRESDLLDAIDGYLANPMTQPLANKPPLASIGGWLAGEDPDRAWADCVDELGCRTFAEACDGHRPRNLVDAAARGGVDELDQLGAWLDEAAACDAPGLGDEASAWLEQVHSEASIGQSAVRAVRAVADGAYERALTEMMALALLWPAARRSPLSVMGPRCSFRPVISQWDDGSWRFDARSAQIDQNAIDALVRWAMQVVSAAELSP